MGNHALADNANVSPRADLDITTHGSDWYYTVCAIMGLSALVMMAMSFRKPQTHRLFNYITAAICFIACIAYFTMGSNLGFAPITVEFPRGGKVHAAGTRAIYYVRYIDWFCTTPLLLLDLLLTAGMPWPTILAVLLADEIMIVCGLVGALTRSAYKWGFWTFGMAAFLYVVYGLVLDGRRHATAIGGDVSRCYTRCGVLTVFLWFLYPVAWGVAEGANVIHPDSEAVFYGVLDLLAKPVFGFLLLLGHRNIDPASLGLHIREPGMIGGPVSKEGYGGAYSSGAVHNGVGHDGVGHDGVGHNGVYNA